MFVSGLDAARRSYRFLMIGYAAMPEHVHLLSANPNVVACDCHSDVNGWNRKSTTKH